MPLCDEWQGEHGFENFKAWCLENGYKRGLVLDRKNTLLGYSPENCRFITLKENNRNRTDTVFVEFHGEIRKLVDLSDEYNMPHNIVYGRIRSGWSIERALTTQVVRQGHKKRNGLPKYYRKRKPLSIAIPYEKAIKEVIKTY